MPIPINSKITGYKVLTDGQVVPEPTKELMHEGLSRPSSLPGNTYKIKPPGAEHAMYITINDIILNAGTEHEERRPYEIFINSKNMEQFQWMVALTRVLSAVFRKGGDVAFLVEELKAVFDPRGGYIKKGGYVPSLVAEIGYVLEEHLLWTGVIKKEELSEQAKAYVEQKLAEFGGEVDESGFPANARVCQKCSKKAVIRLDGCDVCAACGDSKCG
jgi:hypothetical protein